MRKWPFFVLPLFVLPACRQPEKFSDVPYIRFVSLDKTDNGETADDEAELVFYFQDGDGDVGLDDGDTMGVFSPDSAFYYNFLIDFYEKRQGIWTLVPLNPPLHARIPRLSANVPESIKGNIRVRTFINNYNSPYDTVKLSCQLIDRALHASNRMETPETTVRK